MIMSRRRRAWQSAHIFVNRLAWRFAADRSGDYPRPKRKHWLWRLNGWLFYRWWENERPNWEDK